MPSIRREKGKPCSGGGARWGPAGIKRLLLGTLHRLGVYDERARWVGLARVHPDDTFIVSYPKSGNTWLRFLVANMLRPGETVSFRNIESVVPDIYKSRRFINRMAPPRFIKSHEAHFEWLPRSVYIYRDGRDAMVSYYHYQHQRGKFQGDFSRFLRTVPPMGPWHEHVERALMFSRDHPGRMLLLRYEDMLLDAAPHAQKLAEFCGLGVSPGVVAQAVARCGFDELRQIEARFGSEFEKKPNATFFRRGQAQQWREIFTAEDRRYFEALAGPTLRQLGYSW